MGITVEKTGASCGAFVTGIDLTQDISADLASELRAIWLENKVIAFPDQPMSDDDLERFTLAFGAFGEDPFFGHIDGHENIAAIQRNADETTPIFAEFSIPIGVSSKCRRQARTCWHYHSANWRQYAVCQPSDA